MAEVKNNTGGTSGIINAGNVADKLIQSNPLIKPVIKNCSVGAAIQMGEGGVLETAFTVSCSPEATTKVLSELEDTKIKNSVTEAMNKLGVEEGRCGVEASVSSSGGIKAKVFCPAPQ